MDIVRELRQAITIRVPRCYFSEENIVDKTPGNKLHIFTDASQRAYGASAYIVKGNQSSLVMSKNRVAPLKQITLPKLELMGALLGARLAQHLIENLGDMEVNFWPDSQIVLKWIFSTKPLKKFIENRVKEIKGIVKSQQWRYCPTDMNPADLLTRGTAADKITKNTFWTQGPNWIPNEDKWPSWSGNTFTLITSTYEDEEQHDTTLSITTDTNENEHGIHRIIHLTRHNSFKKLLRITACVFRFIRNCRTEKKNRKASSLTVDEIQDATILWIKNAQETNFPDIHKNDGKRSSIVKQLRLYKDENEIFRCGGRIDNALIKDTAKYPYLLPTKHQFTSLVIMDAHENHLHSGISSTVTHLRQTYWIPRIRQCVRSILRKCVTCRKVTGKAYSIPDPPSLPKERVQEVVPFSVTGVDFAGPLYVRNSENTKLKVYLCLFTCASTRALHLDIVPNLTESSFILAFRRFASRKSLPRTLISDNALTFIAASKEIENLTNSPSLHENLSTYGTKWKFIPKRAPWFGGFWERMIGLTKICLKKVLGRSCIDLETLQTVISEIEATLNDRPLTNVSSDSTDPDPLTPSHLLYGRRITCLPYPLTYCENGEHCGPLNNANLNKRLKFQHEIIDNFRKRWKNEYLTSLREYHRTLGHNNQTIQVGDVVQIHDESPRITWKLAVVDELIHGNDKLVRAVNLRTKNGFTNRPIAKLYPIGVSAEYLPTEDATKFRRSKEEAKLKIRQWTL